MISLLWVSIRPPQWSKNLLVFAAILFARRFMEWDLLARAAWGFGCFCLVAGGEYLINDVLDYKADRKHPLKKGRPIASGKLSRPIAITVSLAMGSFGMVAAWFLDIRFFAALGTYLVLFLFYSWFLKHVVLVDVFIIAFGFVLRAVAGAFAVDVSISNWLLICTFLLALFLGFAKRRQELVLLAGKASAHRKNLDDYSKALLDVLIAVLSSTTIVAYALYSFTSHQPDRMMFTVPFVVYGLFRYLYLIYQRGEGGSPEKILLRDIPTLVNIVLWVASSALILA